MDFKLPVFKNYEEWQQELHSQCRLDKFCVLNIVFGGKFIIIGGVWTPAFWISAWCPFTWSLCCALCFVFHYYCSLVTISAWMWFLTSVFLQMQLIDRITNYWNDFKKYRGDLGTSNLYVLKITVNTHSFCLYSLFFI